ncbi:MAG TPA: UDP-N-acetylmuramate dehydrogenase [Ohtaekwangia sp.]
MTFQQHVDLKPFNTFNLSAQANQFVVARSVSDIQQLITDGVFKNQRTLVLGGGSNILLTGSFDGLVIKLEIKGITVVYENEDEVILKVGAGENWHDLVMYCVSHDWGGIENLSLIPGTAGAAPMQNIGAYGVEIKNVIEEVEVIHIDTGKVSSFENAACEFGYRESIFKQKEKGKYIISSITLRLTKKNHRYAMEYGAISDTMKQLGIDKPSVKGISDAVIHIRKSKLPDPAKIGNAGSFFKNPSVSNEEYTLLQQVYPTIPGFSSDSNHTKIPAAWLIEQCGWKGKTFDSIGVHPLQALVIVNYGGGDGRKIWQLALDIQSSVKEKFNIMLQPEVNVI